MPAPKNNQNASKDAGDKADGFLHIRCKRSDKAAWVHAANGQKLSEWVIETLNKSTQPR